MGLATSTPSTRQSKPFGEFPLITIALSSNLPYDTPAKADAILAGSSNPPAYLLVSSTVKERALINAIEFCGRSLRMDGLITTSFIFIGYSVKLICKTTSFAEVIINSGTTYDS